MIINGDTFKELKKIKDNSIDLIIVDPPYGINYKDWDDIDFVSFTQEWVEESMRVLKPTGTLWSFMGWQNIFDFVPILKNNGILHLENWVVWCRQKGRSATKHLKSQREDIFHLTKSKDFTWNPLKMLREVIAPYMQDGKPRGWFVNDQGQRVRWTGLGNVWVYTAPQYNSKLDRQIHPAQKPTLLIERLILLSSNEGDTILDPFMGSGTTGIACLRANRNFIGFELDNEMFEKAKNRIENIEEELSISNNLS